MIEKMTDFTDLLIVYVLALKQIKDKESRRISPAAALILFFVFSSLNPFFKPFLLSV